MDAFKLTFWTCWVDFNNVYLKYQINCFLCVIYSTKHFKRMNLFTLLPKSYEKVTLFLSFNRIRNLSIKNLSLAQDYMGESRWQSLYN